ncbi:MAG: alanine racemase [Candidatus Obscuribacterales bacterium]|nr:alanine racemase [Candidatus Obscuribacterales bacterium]
MLAHRQPMISSVRRDAWLEIDLNAIERNIGITRSWLKAGTRLMAVVKSDAYGHGAAGVADVMGACGASWLGVASIDEGAQLRAAGSDLPILILSPSPSWAMQNALDANLTLTVTSASQLLDLEALCRRQERRASVHLKIDTGMHRLGVLPKNLGDIIKILKQNKWVKLEGVFTHFAKADEEDFTLFQTAVFEKALQEIEKEGLKASLIHLASSDACRRFPKTHFDMVRVGLYLYGLEAKKASDFLEAAMSVKARINQIQNLDEGESLGYNLTWTTSKASRIASIPIGYADGIDRRLSNNMKALLMGKEIKQVGLISMDQMLFDVSEVPDAQEGDIVTLIGRQEANKSEQVLPLADWANKLDTITYELACRLRARMPRIYTRNFQLEGKHE